MSAAAAGWIDRFFAADGPRRQAMCEAIAWKLKEGGDAIGKSSARFMTDLPALEDLLTYTMLALIPPRDREKLAPMALGFIGSMIQTGALPPEKAEEARTLFERVFDRVAVSTYEDNPSERPHPFEKKEKA